MHFNATTESSSLPISDVLGRCNSHTYTSLVVVRTVSVIDKARAALGYKIAHIPRTHWCIELQGSKSLASWKRSLPKTYTTHTFSYDWWLKPLVVFSCKTPGADPLSPIAFYLVWRMKRCHHLISSSIRHAPSPTILGCRGPSLRTFLASCRSKSRLELAQCSWDHHDCSKKKKNVQPYANGLILSAIVRSAAI